MGNSPSSIKKYEKEDVAIIMKSKSIKKTYKNMM